MDNIKENQLAVCINNDGCEDLEVRKVYEVIPDEKAAEDNYLRVVDESGEDYLYPADRFYPLDVSASVRESILHAA